MPSALHNPAAQNQSLWKKASGYALLALLVVFSNGADLTCLAEGLSNRKRVFSPGFIAVCVFVAVVELILLNHFYGTRG